MTLPAERETTEVIHKFQSLLAGQYWRAKLDEGEHIKSGLTYLIESIQWVDNAPHTIILRAHPLVYSQWRKSHHFLCADFLQKFEFEPDAKAIRESELAEVQGIVATLQDELINTQSDPEKMNQIVNAELNEGVDNLPVISPADAQKFVADGVMGALGTGVTAENIETIKLAASREHKIATIKSKWIQNQTSKIASTIAKMTPFYEEQAACALAQTEEVRTYVDNLMKGIESLDLYVGKEVTVVTMKEGESAPEGEPLSLVQKKLLMDEELAVHIDIDNWFDFRNVKQFRDELAANQSLVDQIFPTKRCVLVMATTRRHIDYGDPYANMYLNAKNEAVFILVRDGENLYQVYSPVESHLGSSRLFPSKNDQEGIFHGFDGSQITFNDLAYTRALKTHEMHALHYKRFLILLCGLDHRLDLFGKFYEGPKSMHFVSLAFQEKYCRFIHDDDGEGMLPNPDIRPSVYEWVNSMNKYLRPGSRFFAYWPSFVNLYNCPVMYNKSQTMRDTDRYRINRPCNQYAVEKIQRSGRDFIVKIPADSEYGNRSKFLATVTIATSELENRVNGICMDAVEIEDLEYYIHHRASRIDHIEYIRLFKHMLKFIKHEREKEKSTRNYLLNTLEQNNVGLPEQRAELVNKSIIAWRAEHNGKELPVGELATGKALKPILDHMYYLANMNGSDLQNILQVVEVTGSRPIRVSRTGKAIIVVYATLREAQNDYVLEENPFLNRIVLESAHGKYSIRSSSLELLPEKSASETTLYESDDAAGFVKKSIFKTNSVKERYLKILAEAKSIFMRYSEPISETEFKVELSRYRNIRYEKSKDRVVNPKVYVPVGMYKYPTLSGNEQYEVALVYLIADHAALVHYIAPNDEARKVLRKIYVDLYANKDQAVKDFNNEVSNVASHELWCCSKSALINQDPEKSGFGFSRKKAHQFTYDEFIRTEFKESSKFHGVNRELEYFIDPSMLGQGGIILDQMLGVKLPVDFERYKVFCLEQSFSKNKGLVVSKYEDQLDELTKGFRTENIPFNVNYTNERFFTTHEKLKAFIESEGFVFGEASKVNFNSCDLDIYVLLEQKDCE